MGIYEKKNVFLKNFTEIVHPVSLRMNVKMYAHTNVTKERPVHIVGNIIVRGRRNCKER